MTGLSTVVDTANGPIRGSDDGLVKVWRGVRYAAAPTGDLRWRAPEPPEPWREVVDATGFSPVCPQPVEPRIPIDLGAPQGDDCLSLNVWAPSDTAAGDGKPVMVWIHGGAYIFGSASQPLYDGAVLSAGGDVVVVTVNYRVGAFGFLDLSSFSTPTRRFDSNPGLRDVILALQWVRDNIAAFGGDPNRVTLFGESAGAGIVTTLLTTPVAAGLFSAAIAQSSPATSVYDTTRGRRVAEEFVDALGLGPNDVDRLTDVPADAIVAASRSAVQRRAVAQPWPAGVRADRRRRSRTRLSRQAGARGSLASCAVDHRHQQARGGTVQVDEVAADADHAARDPADVRRDGRRTTRRAAPDGGPDRGRLSQQAYEDPGHGCRARHRLPNAVGVAGRGAQRCRAGVPVPIRLVHPDAARRWESAPPTPPNCPMFGAI